MKIEKYIQNFDLFSNFSMEERYRQSEVSATEMVGALASNDLALHQENTYKDIHNLVAALTSSVTTTLGEVCQHLHVVGENDL